MQYKNKKTGALVSVRDDKVMDSDWVRINFVESIPHNAEGEKTVEESDEEQSTSPGDDFDKMTVKELKVYADEHDFNIDGLSKKAELIAALRTESN